MSWFRRKSFPVIEAHQHSCAECGKIAKHLGTIDLRFPSPDARLRTPSAPCVFVRIFVCVQCHSRILENDSRVAVLPARADSALRELLQKPGPLSQ